MTLENGRDLVRGVLILLFAGLALWLDRNAGLLLVTLMGVLILQSSFTNWCPADVFLRPLGLSSANRQDATPREEGGQAGAKDS